MSSVVRLRLWPLRALWVLLALAGGTVAGDALDGRSTPVVGAVAAWAWLGWAAALVAMLVPRTSSLTVVRVLVPAGWAATIAAVAVGDEAGPLRLPGVRPGLRGGLANDRARRESSSHLSSRESPG